MDLENACTISVRQSYESDVIGLGLGVAVGTMGGIGWVNDLPDPHQSPADNANTRQDCIFRVHHDHCGRTLVTSLVHPHLVSSQVCVRASRHLTSPHAHFVHLGCIHGTFHRLSFWWFAGFYASPYFTFQNFGCKRKRAWEFPFVVIYIGHEGFSSICNCV